MIITGKHVHGIGGAKRSVKRQKQKFAKLGLLGAESFYDGTINLNTLPKKYKVINYDYFFKDVVHRFFPTIKKESFGFIEIIELEHCNKKYDNWGYIYFPQKSPHIGKPGFFELIGRKIDSFNYNDSFKLTIKDGLIKEI